MEFNELKIILKRLYLEYVKKHIKRILVALTLSIIVAISTSGIAWLLDPAVKKIFIEQDKTLANGLNIVKGKIVYEEIAEAFNWRIDNI